MGIVEIFSKRQKRLNGKQPDIINHNVLPAKLRVQIVHILRDTLGRSDQFREIHQVYQQIKSIVCREHGVFNLLLDYQPSVIDEICNSITRLEIDIVLDIIELSFRASQHLDETRYRQQCATLNSSDAIDELNERFKENAVGYRFEGGQLIRVDSTIEYQEVTKPTIFLLHNDARFKPVCDEYMNAHDHYKKGLNKECMNSCLKSFESTMKIICDIKSWKYTPKDGATKLIQICFDNQLIPSYLQSEFTALRAVLESGIPTIRNQVSAHGGTQNNIADSKLSRYVLHLTGANIIYLIEQSNL
ncbi:MAG: hypothetical protein EKK57_04765 [Proteobacteria bacterium]|nr:MAG: hypothetical protein EKK57_04765 [Pseudomonadota bacterium]